MDAKVQHEHARVCDLIIIYLLVKSVCFVMDMCTDMFTTVNDQPVIDCSLDDDVCNVCTKGRSLQLSVLYIRNRVAPLGKQMRHWFCELDDENFFCQSTH